MTFNRTNISNCPCKDCPDRAPGCHGKCERFLAWQKWNEERRDRERNERRSKDVMSDAKKRAIWKKMRRDRAGGRKWTTGTE